MITESDLSKDFPVFFTTNGKDVWRLRSFCPTPTVDLINEKTGETREFGLGGSLAEEFQKLETKNFQ